MSRKTLKNKNPLSAKSIIKSELVGQFGYLTRLKNIQRYIKEHDNVDGILAIMGVDSWHDEGSNKLINYLFFNIFEKISNEIEKYKIEEEELEDIVLLVEESKIHVYCNPINYKLCMEVIANWGNVQLYCLNNKDHKTEKGEEFKILSFINMVKNCRKIGLFLTNSNDKFDKMKFEKWPLIQAYALDEFQTGGFFTLQHDVYPISVSDTVGILSQLDCFNLEKLMLKDFALFERHWLEIIAMLRRHVEKGDDINEEKLTEPLISYYNHSCRNFLTKSKLKFDESLKPFCIFGPNTCKKNLQTFFNRTAVNVNLLKSEDDDGNFFQDDLLYSSKKSIDLKSGGHVVCCGSEPTSGLICVRSMFMRFGDKNGKYYECDRNLQKIYSALGDLIRQTLRKAHQLSEKGNIISSMKTTCLKDLAKYLDKYHVPSPLLRQSASNFHILARRESENVVTLIGIIYDLPIIDAANDDDDDNLNLNSTTTADVVGSLAYGDTILITENEKFLDNNDNDNDVDMKDGSGDNEKDKVELYGVESFFPLESLATDVCLGQIDSNDSKRLETSEFLNDGKNLAIGTGCLYIPNNDVKFDGCRLTFDLNGDLHLRQDNLPTLFLDSSVVWQRIINDRKSNDEPLIICLRLRKTAVDYLPICLTNNDCMLTFCIDAKEGQTCKQLVSYFYTYVLPVWKENVEKIELKILDENQLPKCVNDILSNILEKELKAKKWKYETSKKLSTINNFNKFIERLEFNGIFGKDTLKKTGVTKNQLKMISKDNSKVVKSATKNDRRRLITLNLLCATKAAYSRQFYECLKTFLKSDNVQLSPDFLLFNTELNDYIDYLKDSSNDAKKSYSNCLLFVACNTNIYHLITALETDKRLKSVYKLGTITVCLNAETLTNFSKGRQYAQDDNLLIEKIRLANNIVWTTSLDMLNSPTIDSNRLRARIINETEQFTRAINKRASFFTSSNGTISNTKNVESIFQAVDDNEEWESLQVVLKRLAYGEYFINDGQIRGSSSIGDGGGGWTCRVLKVKEEAVFDQGGILKCLKGLNTNKSGKLYENVYYVYGVVKCSEKGSTIEIESSPLTDYHTLEKLQYNNTNKKTVKHFLLFLTDKSIDNNQQLIDYFQSSNKYKLSEKKALLRRENVSMEEIKGLEKSIANNPLPDGWFFNGYQYISMTGEKTDRRPDIDEYLKEYIRCANDKIELYNASIKDAKYVGLFD